MQSENLIKEATRILQELIRIDTTNPPGNEMVAAEYLAEKAAERGLEASVIETAPGRGNFILRCPGKDPQKPPLILLSHLDVVPAEPEEWFHNPFSGLLEDGWIWGRGALDTKHLTVMQLFACFFCVQEGITPDRDIIMVATADEEQGGKIGIQKLLAKYPEMFRKATVISEGGGFPLVKGDKLLYLCEAGQKGHLRAEFAFSPPEGESPFLPTNNQYLSAARLVKRLESFQWPGKVPATTSKLIKLMEENGFLEEIDRLKPLLEAMEKNTLTATVWEGGKQSKGITKIVTDGRILPGVNRKEVEKVLNDLTRGIEGDWEITSFSPGFATSGASMLLHTFDYHIQKQLSNAKVVPFIATGGSDGRHLQGVGANVYGFSPVLPDLPFDQVISMVHGRNEKISQDSLLFGIQVLTASVIDYCKG